MKNVVEVKNMKKSTNNKKILDVSNLTVQFGQEVAVSNVSFSVNEHDVIVLLGPNGAGKSTLFKALLGLVPHTGTVHWATKNIGYLPPQESLIKKNLPPLTVKDFFSLKAHVQQQALSLLNEVGLSEEIFDKQFATLSTGQFQRMLLAWVLVDKPSVLLLDEPLASIDIGGEETVYSLLHKMWKKWDLTIMLITHNVSIVWKHANNILCMNKKLICYGSPETTLTPDTLQKVYGMEVALYEHRHPIK